MNQQALINDGWKMHSSKISLNLLIIICSLMAQPMTWVNYFIGGGPGDPMQSMCIDGHGTIWAIRNSHQPPNPQIICINKEQTVSCKVNMEGVIDRKNFSRVFVVSKTDNRLLMFAFDSLIIYNIGNNNLTQHKAIPYDGKYYIGAALQLKDGRIIVSTTDTILKIYQNDKFTPILSPGVHIEPSFEDHNGNVWAQSTDGAYVYKNNEWQHYNSNNSGLKCGILTSTGKCFVEDKQGNIIAGTSDSGLYVFKNDVWQKFTPSIPGAPENCIRCLAIDSSNVIWAGTNNGILRLENGSWYKYSSNDFQKFNTPFGNSVEIIVDNQNSVWIAMLHNGVFKLNQTGDSSCYKAISFNVSYPMKNSIFKSGTLMDLKWETFGDIPFVRIHYRIGTNVTWSSVEPKKDSIANSTITQLYVPKQNTNEFYLRIRAIKDSTVQSTIGPLTITSDTQNLPPKLLNLPDSISVKSDEISTWSAHSVDPEKDSLIYQFTNLPTWITARDSILTFKPDNKSATTSIKVIVADTHGGKDSASVKVVVPPPTATDIKHSVTLDKIVISKCNNYVTISANIQDVKKVNIYTISGKYIASALRDGKQYKWKIDNKTKNGIYVIKLIPSANSSIVNRSFKFLLE